MKYICASFFFFLFFSCTKLNLFSETLVSLIEKGTDSTFLRSYGPNSGPLYYTSTHFLGGEVRTYLYYERRYPSSSDFILKETKNFFSGDLYGHNFIFYDNGKLKEYNYFSGVDNKYTYSRRYGLDENLIEELGTPFVDDIKNENDSSVSLLFSTVFFDSVFVELSTKKHLSIGLSLEKSMMQIMLSKGTINLKDSIVYMKITGIDNKNHEKKVYLDTLNL